MSDVRPTARLRERIAGKWQIPALFLSVALLFGSILQIKPPAARLPVEKVLVEMEALHRGGLYSATLKLGRRLLEREEECSPEQLGRIHLFLGRAGFQQAEREDRHTPAAARRIIDEFDAAREAGVTLSGRDLQHLGEAYEWLGALTAAVDHYEAAIAAEPPPALGLRKRVIELRCQKVQTPVEQIHELLDGFIADASQHPDRLYWATELKVNLLLTAGEHARAEALVERLRGVFETLAGREAFEYLFCLVAYRAGQYDQAEARLRALRNRLTIRDETFARTGWLLGRVVLNDGGAQRPAEAISFFRDVIHSRASGVYTAASELGMAEALAELRRYDESLEFYTKAVAALTDLGPSRILNRDAVRSSITVVGNRLRRDGEYQRALRFVDLAMSLVDADDLERRSLYLEQLGDIRAALARSLREDIRRLPSTPEAESRRVELSEQVRQLLFGAGEAFVTLARITALNEPRSAAAAWRAADLFDEGGDRARTIALLRRFVRERPENRLAPRAWVRLGQSLQALGRFEEAIEAYQAGIRRFPRTLDAHQSLIPLASCYVALGSEYADLAEKTLRRVLGDWKLFTPAAPEFRDALFLLGDLLNREARYEEAISALEEALERYADDPRHTRGLFLLADSYCRSGLAMKEDLKEARFVGERLRMQKEYRRRLERASELFGTLIARYEAEGEEALDNVNRLYLRHARLHQGDCLFELQRYDEALKLYERAAWIYKELPSSLAAYVQIINCNIFLGQAGEARAALRRAQYLVNTLADEAFEQSAVRESRDEWKEYFDWIERSGLF